MDKLKTWLSNLPTFHHRIMMRYLRKRGWVVFYLEEQARTCNDGTCWLRLYEQKEGRMHRDAKPGDPGYDVFIASREAG